MIRYALVCAGEHEFEAWFSNSSSFDEQKSSGLLECPVCGSADVRKQIMAPAVRDSGEKAGRSHSPETEAARIAGEIRRKIASTHDYVGDRFAEEARSMFYGQTEQRPVWGEVAPETARELIEEGVPAVPLPKPFAPDPPKKRSEVN